MSHAKAILAKGAACASCKARKVKCSATRPSCDACRRSARFRGDDPAAVVCSYFEGRRCSANGAIGRGSQRVRRAKHASIEDSDASSTASTESGGSATPPSTAGSSLGGHVSRSSSPVEERQKRLRPAPTARSRPPPPPFEAYKIGSRHVGPDFSSPQPSAQSGWSSWTPFELAPAPAPPPLSSTAPGLAAQFAVLSAPSLPIDESPLQTRTYEAKSAPYLAPATSDASPPDFSAASFDEIGFAHIDSLIGSVLLPPLAGSTSLDSDPIYTWANEIAQDEPKPSASFNSELAFGDAFLPTAHDYAQTLSLPLFSSMHYA
ncbi:hypothetical protein JCM3774_006440 [Rhodotorula dairenensis]